MKKEEKGEKGMEKQKEKRKKEEKDIKKEEKDQIRRKKKENLGSFSRRMEQYTHTWKVYGNLATGCHTLEPIFRFRSHFWSRFSDLGADNWV